MSSLFTTFYLYPRTKSLINGEPRFCVQQVECYSAVCKAWVYGCSGEFVQGKSHSKNTPYSWIHGKGWSGSPRLWSLSFETVLFYGLLSQFPIVICSIFQQASQLLVSRNKREVAIIWRSTEALPSLCGTPSLIGDPFKVRFPLKDTQEGYP